MILIKFLETNEESSVESGTSLSCEGKANTISMLLYVNYTKGSEDGMNISIDLYDSTLNEWYPLQQWDGSSINPIVFKITESGKYRIPVPVAANESQMRINVALDGTDDSSTNVTIFVQPESVRGKWSI